MRSNVEKRLGEASERVGGTRVYREGRNRKWNLDVAVKSIGTRTEEYRGKKRFGLQVIFLANILMTNF